MLSRVRVVSRQASDAAEGREVAGRMERLMGEERGGLTGWRARQGQGQEGEEDVIYIYIFAFS